MDIHHLIIQFSVDGHFDYLQHFVIANITAMGNCTHTALRVCASSICKINSLELGCWAQRQIFNFGKHWKFCFCRHCVYMHLPQQYVKGPVSTHVWQLIVTKLLNLFQSGGNSVVLLLFCFVLTTAVLGYNSFIARVTLLKHTVQWVSAYSQSCANISAM